MGQKATSIEEQINILKKRGINFDMGEAKAKEILLDIGYYRLGFYWHPFEKDAEHNFKDGTCFSDVVSLYYLDVDLRNILLKYLKRIEVNFRTKVVYHVSNKYKHDPVWYTNPDVMNNWFLKERLKSFYSKQFRNDNKQIKKHHEKYRNDKYAPVWKTFEFFTFGYVLTIFNSLKSEDVKREISTLYGLSKLKTFKNIMSTIKFIRNTSAHGGVLFDLNMPMGISKIPNTSYNNNNNQSIDSGMKAMLYVLNHISNDRARDMKLEVKNRLEREKHNKVLQTIIKEKMGYIFE